MLKPESLVRRERVRSNETFPHELEQMGLGTFGQAGR
jgi:hypothetical protein